MSSVRSKFPGKSAPARMYPSPHGLTHRSLPHYYIPDKGWNRQDVHDILRNFHPLTSHTPFLWHRLPSPAWLHPGNPMALHLPRHLPDNALTKAHWSHRYIHPVHQAPSFHRIPDCHIRVSHWAVWYDHCAYPVLLSMYRPAHNLPVWSWPSHQPHMFSPSHLDTPRWTQMSP